MPGEQEIDAVQTHSAAQSAAAEAMRERSWRQRWLDAVCERDRMSDALEQLLAALGDPAELKAVIVDGDSVERSQRIDAVIAAVHAARPAQERARMRTDIRDSAPKRV